MRISTYVAYMCTYASVQACAGMSSSACGHAQVGQTTEYSTGGYSIGFSAQHNICQHSHTGILASLQLCTVAMWYVHATCRHAAPVTHLLRTTPSSGRMRRKIQRMAVVVVVVPRLPVPHTSTMHATCMKFMVRERGSTCRDLARGRSRNMLACLAHRTHR